MIAKGSAAAAARAGIGAAMLLVGCHSSSGAPGAATDAGPGDGPPGAAGARGTTHISAANGGTVKDPAGNTTLTIPAGALAQDTDITLQIIPKYAQALVPVSVFLPDGLAFAKPATLSIKGDPSLEATGATLVIGLDGGDGAFAPVPGSSYANGAATAPIMHFSSYTLMSGPPHPNCALPSESCSMGSPDHLPCCQMPNRQLGQPGCQLNTYRCCVIAGEYCTKSEECCGDVSNLATPAQEQICQGGVCCSLPGFACSDSAPCCDGRACVVGNCMQ